MGGNDDSREQRETGERKSSPLLDFRVVGYWYGGRTATGEGIDGGDVGNAYRTY